MCVWTLPTTFQSTPSAWRETAVLQSPLYGFYISIHSLRMEGDIKETPKTSMKSFQSTPSAWRETIGVVETVTPIWDFNPLPPHGGRRTFLLMLLLHRTFQSTPSAWRETDRIHDGRNSEAISIHSLRMEGDIG